VELTALEEEVWNQMKTAQENRDSVKIGKLSNMAQEIEKIKKDVENIRISLQLIKEDKLEGSERSVSWEITDGAIKQNYLSITRLIKSKLIPLDGSEFEIETSEGQRFKTVALIPANRLRERGKIAEFYKKGKVKAGDKILWQEIDSHKYRLIKL
jgi:hypothetical protein